MLGRYEWHLRMNVTLGVAVGECVLMKVLWPINEKLRAAYEQVSRLQV
jgi:hypothetical protein